MAAVSGLFWQSRVQEGPHQAGRVAPRRAARAHANEKLIGGDGNDILWAIGPQEQHERQRDILRGGAGDKIPEWVGEIHRHLPIADDGALRLAQRCEIEGGLRRRVRVIAERGHLDSVTIERIRRHLRDAGLDDNDFLEGDESRLDNESPFRLVYVLNEDFFRGGLTDTDFRSRPQVTAVEQILDDRSSNRAFSSRAHEPLALRLARTTWLPGTAALGEGRRRTRLRRDSAVRSARARLVRGLGGRRS